MYVKYFEIITTFRGCSMVKFKIVTFCWNGKSNNSAIYNLVIIEHRTTVTATWTTGGTAMLMNILSSVKSQNDFFCNEVLKTVKNACFGKTLKRMQMQLLLYCSVFTISKTIVSGWKWTFSTFQFYNRTAVKSHDSFWWKSILVFQWVWYCFKMVFW